MCLAFTVHSGNILESFIGIYALIPYRINGGDGKIVAGAAAQPQLGIRGDVTHTQALPKGLEINARSGAVVHAVT